MPRICKSQLTRQAKKIRVAGSVSLNSKESKSPKNEEFALEGVYDEQGTATLRPSNSLEKAEALKIRVLTTCIDKVSGDCDKIVADIFVFDPETNKYHFTQIQSKDEQSKDEQSKAKQSMAAPFGNSTKDIEGEPDLYVSNTYTNFDKLFKDSGPASDKSKEPSNVTRPRDQAIGLPDSGSLQNASDLLAKIASAKIPLDIPNQNRERFYGTFELVELLIHMGLQAQKLALGYSLQVSDLSQKAGGRLLNSRHASHQNGLDVDVGYFTKGRKPNTENFPNVVVGKSLRPDFLIDETLKYFHKLFLESKGGIDRIFVNQVIKDGFCKRAKDPVFMASVSDRETLDEVLRRLRVWEGHDDHFHLRLKCSKFQPRCRQKTEPPLGSGCQ